MDSLIPPGSETTPPPIAPRNWWTWIVFASLAGMVVFSNLSAIFDPEARATVDPAATEVQSASLALKQFAALEELEIMARDSGMTPPAKQVGDAGAGLAASIKGLKARSAESEEAAKWLLTLQAVRGDAFDVGAVSKLQGSKDPDTQAVGKAFAGKPLPRGEPAGDEPPQRVARWISTHPGAEKVPAAVTGAKTNVFALGSILLWLGFIFISGLASLIAYALLKRNGGLPAKGYQTGISLAGTDARGARMAIYFGVFLTMSAIPLAISKTVPRLEPFLIAMLAATYLAVILLTPAFSTVPLFGDRIRFKEIIGDTSKLGQKLGWGFCGYAANFPMFLLAIGVTAPLQKILPPPSHEIIELVRNSGPIDQVLLYFVAAGAAPLIEEPMFRGVLFPAFQRLMASPTAAIIASGFVFAVVHPQGPLLWLPLALIGMTGAVLTRQTGSLIPAILMHFLHNSTIYLLSLFTS